MEEEKQDASAPVPAGQKFFDHLFLLLALSILISTALYNVWGIVELMTRPALP